jgi:hypothetical protein
MMTDVKWTSLLWFSSYTPEGLKSCTGWRNQYFPLPIILWHVNPLLGYEMLNELLRRQTLNKQSVAKLHNNRTRLCNPLLSSSSVNRLLHRNNNVILQQWEDVTWHVLMASCYATALWTLGLRNSRVSYVFCVSDQLPPAMMSCNRGWWLRDICFL